MRPDGSDDHRLPLGCQAPCIGVKGPTWAEKKVLFVTRVIGPIDERAPGGVAAVGCPDRRFLEGPHLVGVGGREVRGQLRPRLTRRLLRDLDAGPGLRRQVDHHARRLRRGRRGSAAALGLGRRGQRPLHGRERADPGPGDLRVQRPRGPEGDVRRHRRVPDPVQLPEAVREEDRVADRQQGEREARRQPPVVARRPRLRLQPPEERHEQARRHLDGELRLRRAPPAHVVEALRLPAGRVAADKAQTSSETSSSRPCTPDLR